MLRTRFAGGGMGRAVEITRRDLSASDLRAAAVRSGDGRVACRLLAIARLLEGTSRREAAESCGMERQTLRDWVHRYNDQGIGGLSDCPRSGRPPALSAAQQAELKELVIAGPDPQRDGVVRWRCLDLRRDRRALFRNHARANRREMAAPSGPDPIAAASLSSEAGCGSPGGV